MLVDTRDLANLKVRDPSLPHWQAAAAWWESRLQMTGPMGERMELCFFPATEHTGLHNVHPTWAGTFVLAALGASFPGKLAQFDLDHCHVGDYNLGSCGTSMTDICCFFAEQY